MGLSHGEWLHYHRQVVQLVRKEEETAKERATVRQIPMVQL